jgi:hypothetical protein
MMWFLVGVLSFWAATFLKKIEDNPAAAADDIRLGLSVCEFDIGSVRRKAKPNMRPLDGGAGHKAPWLRLLRLRLPFV